MHTVYFLDGDGRLIDEPRRVACGQSIQPPDYTPPQGHTFLGWSRDVTRVKEDVYCVALTKAAEFVPPPAQPRQPEVVPSYRVYVLDLRGTNPAGRLLPLGNWSAGELVSEEDLACLHLRHAAQLRFRLHVSCDTMLVLTDVGVRAFCRSSMCPLSLSERELEWEREFMLHTQQAQAA